MEVGVAVIGCGYIATSNHLPILAGMISDARLVAVADVDKRRAEAAAKTYGAETWYTDYKELLENPQVKAVWICTPPFLHAQMVIDAAKAGKHVMCEIPMALTLEEADAMIEAAVSFNVLLMAGYHYNFAPAYVKAKELIEQGKIGKPVMAHSSLSFCFKQWALGKRWLWNVEKGGHQGGAPVPRLEFLLNSKIVKIYSGGGTLAFKKEGNVEDNVAWLVEFDNGAIGVTEYSGVVAERILLDRSKIIGDTGSVMDIEQSSLLRLQTNGLHSQEWSFRSPFEKTSEGHLEEDQHFIKCIKERKTPRMTGKDWRHILETYLAAAKSRKTGKAIEV
ncbi:Gfo/Idh/MocA family oxidoreductase [Candidatus Bathyarchaeota archaeon]|nr:Gfo/Idh/MocA family oxidoreductase [Candidatus Bathyarchaeota archaeon]